jgi:hypothetical protein
MNRPVKILLIAVLACAMVFICTVVSMMIINKFDLFGTSRNAVTSEFIGHRIQEISELGTLHHQYRKMASYQDVAKLVESLPDWRINRSIKEFVLIYKGDVKLGYDMKDIQIFVDKITKTITITLPDPKILSHSIDFESIDVVMEKAGWFNSIKFEDFKKFFVYEQKKYEQENYDELKKRAKEQAQRIIFLYLSAILEIEEPAQAEEKSFMQKLISPEKFKIELK